MNHINLFLTFHKYQTSEVQIGFTLQNLCIYYTFKKIRKQYKTNKPKIIALTWNNDFELPDGSYYVSDTQDYIECIIKDHETLTTVPPIHLYINRINSKLVFKMKNEYKLQSYAKKYWKNCPC